MKIENGATKLTLRHHSIPHKKGADSFGEGWMTRAFSLLKDVSEGKKLNVFCFESGSECGDSK